MKIRSASGERGDTTALDVMAIILAAVVVVGLLYALPSRRWSSQKANRIRCVNNLKQVGLAFRLWSSDNGDIYQMQVSTNSGGTMEFVSSGMVFPNYSVMSNYLSTPRILICPADTKRSYATNFDATFGNPNISYFVVSDADETMPTMWLSGDRNLAAANAPLKAGLFTNKANAALSWTTALHKNQGNIAFADGSVQQLTSLRLHESATNALRAYFNATATNSFRIAIP